MIFLRSVLAFSVVCSGMFEGLSKCFVGFVLFEKCLQHEIKCQHVFQDVFVLLVHIVPGCAHGCRSCLQCKPWSSRLMSGWADSMNNLYHGRRCWLINRL